MAIDNNNLRYLVDPFWQGEGINGKPLVAGWVCVYYAGTDVKVITKQSFDGTDNPFKIPLNNDGRAVILVPGGAKYDAYVYDSFGNLAFSRLNITPVGDNGGDISGLSQIFHDDTLTGDGSYHDPLGAIEYTGILPIDVNNDLHLISAQTTRLGVQEPLYFVQDDDEMTVIGLSGGTVPEGTMNESAFGYEDGQITSYNGSAFSAGLNYQAGDNIVINGNEIALDSAITLVDQSHTKGMQLDATEQQFTNLTSNNGSILDASGLYVSDLNMENAANLSKDGLYVTGTGSRISMSNDMSDIYGEHHFEIYGYQESGDGVSSMILGGNDLIVEHGENHVITASYSLTGACQSAVSALNTITSTSGNYYPMTGNPSGFLTAHQDISDKLDTTAFSTVSGDFLTAIPPEYVTENTLQSGLSSKLDSTAFSTVSGDFLTAHQSLDGLMSAGLLEISDNKITGYNGTAFAGQGGGVTGDYELSAGSGISIVDYPLEQKTVISVTAQGGNPEVEQAVIDNSATWNTVTGKLDNSAVKTAMTLFGSPMVTGISDYYISAGYANYANHDSNGNEITGYYATVDSLTAKQDSLTFGYKDTAISSIDESAIYDNSAHARITTLAGRISDLSSNKLDTTAFSDVSGTFLTAHQDLSDYQTTAGMTAYQPVGSYLTADALDSVSGDWNEVSAKLDTTAFSDVSGTFLTAHQDISNKLDTTAFSDVSGSFLTGIPDTYLQNTDLSTEDGKVTAISGIPLSAGGDVPEGVMVESAVGYNAVNEISGYNGSAIAQYGAEKQWLAHDDTLVHASNSAQYALGCNVSALQRLMGIDETVLWSGSINISANPIITANESVQNFEKVEFIGKGYPSNYDTNFGTCFFNSQSTDSTLWLFGHAGGSNGGAIRFNQCRISASDNILAIEQTKQFNITGTATTTANTPALITKIIGIHRISG